MFSGHFMSILHLLPELVNVFPIGCDFKTITCVLTAENKLRWNAQFSPYGEQVKRQLGRQSCLKSWYVLPWSL